MAISNKMTDLINKVEDRLGLGTLVPHLPEYCNKNKWAEVVTRDTLMTFSRKFFHMIPFEVNKDSCVKKKIHGKWVYFIRDEYLEGLVLLGIEDIDWSDITANNTELSNVAGYGLYTTNYFGCYDCTFETMAMYQMNADMCSLASRGIYVDFLDPNGIILSAQGNVNINLNRFMVKLLVKHPDNLSTISPTMMEKFEELAQADIARYLLGILKYIDGLETVYVNLDLKLSELEKEADKRDSIIEELDQARVSASNANIPLIITLN